MRGALGSGLLSVTHKGLGFLLAILLARWLGAEDYGYYAFAASLMGLLAVPGQLGLPQFITREIARLHVGQCWHAMTAVRTRAIRLACCGAAGSMLTAVAILLLGESVPAIDAKTTWLALALLPLLIMSELLSGLLRGLRKVVHAIWPSNALKPGGIILLVVALAVATPASLTPSSVMLVTVAVTALALAALYVLLKRFWPVPSHATARSDAAVVSFGSLLSFTLLGASNIIVQKTDVVMLGFLASADDVGVYFVLVQGAMLVSFGFAAVNSVLGPYIARFSAAGNTEGLQRLMSRSSLAVFGLALIVFGILLTFGEEILGAAFGEEFRRGHGPLVVLAVGQLVNASVGSVGTFLSMTGHEKATSAAILIAAVVNVALNATLIPLFGILGAAYATMLSTVLWNVIMSAAVYRRLGIVPGPFIFKAVAGGEP